MVLLHTVLSVAQLLTQKTSVLAAIQPITINFSYSSEIYYTYYIVIKIYCIILYHLPTKLLYLNTRLVVGLLPWGVL